MNLTTSQRRSALAIGKDLAGHTGRDPALRGQARRRLYDVVGVDGEGGWAYVLPLGGLTRDPDQAVAAWSEEGLALGLGMDVPRGLPIAAHEYRAALYIGRDLCGYVGRDPALYEQARRRLLHDTVCVWRDRHLFYGLPCGGMTRDGDVAVKAWTEAGAALD